MDLTSVGKVLGVGHPGSLALQGDLILTVFASATLKSSLSHCVRDLSSLFPGEAGADLPQAKQCQQEETLSQLSGKSQWLFLKQVSSYAGRRNSFRCKADTEN